MVQFSECAARRGSVLGNRTVVYCRFWICLLPCLLSSAARAGEAPPPRSGEEGRVAEMRLQAALRAGEYAPAVREALAQPVAQRRETLQRIVAAQRQAGDFSAAAETIGYLPPSSERTQLQQELARDSRPGGAQADFDSLINLITNTVVPESWTENGGQGTLRPFETGVRVDPRGVLRQLSRDELHGTLPALQARARRANLNSDMARPSALRVVSLTRLERAIAARLARGEPVLETMHRLAGLYRLQYVLLDADHREILLAGPAEGWEYDPAGRALGLASHAPVLDLDDLVTALRTFSPGGDEIFGCSINPRSANLQRVKTLVEGQATAGPLSPGGVRTWVQQLQQTLGEQDVLVYGIPADTHAAHILVEADYRMKLIGIDKLEAGPQIPSFFDLLEKDRKARTAPLTALRWWLTMKYSALRHSPDRQAFELAGPAVQVLSENQFITAQGEHVSTGGAEPLNRQFAQNFTAHYAAVSSRYPVFAELRNLFDAGLAAALLQQEAVGARFNWDYGVFGPRGGYLLRRYPVVQTVPTVAHHRTYNGREVVIQVAGGVRGNLAALARDRLLRTPAPELQTTQSLARQGESAVPGDRWWWDSAEK